MVIQVLLEHKVHWEIKVCREQQVHLDPVDRREHRVQQDLLETLELLVIRVNLARLGRQAIRVFLDSKVLQVQVVCKVLQEELVHQVQLVLQD